MSFIGILNSNFFVGIVTLLAGGVALFIYSKQKRDSKTDAASIILQEIQNAERVLEQVRERVQAGTLPNNFLLPNDSWSKYKYLFVRDFDRDEWDTISAFYTNCKLYDEAVSYNNSFFQKNEEQIRVNMIRIPADYIKGYLDTEVDIPLGSADLPSQNERLVKAFNNAAEFQRLYLSRADLLLYTPQKPLTDSKTYVDNMRVPLSQLSIGSKLKILANIKS